MILRSAWTSKPLPLASAYTSRTSSAIVFFSSSSRSMRSMMALSWSLANFVAGASLTAAAVVAIGFSWMELTVRLKEEAPHAFPRTASQHDPQECAALRQANIPLIHSAPTRERLHGNFRHAWACRGVDVLTAQAARRGWPGQAGHDEKNGETKEGLSA